LGYYVLKLFVQQSHLKLLATTGPHSIALLENGVDWAASRSVICQFPLVR
jgi:hypothetical protein